MARAFPNRVTSYQPATDSIFFLGDNNGKTIWCSVSREANEDAMKASRLDHTSLLMAFEHLRAKIEVIASHKYVRGAFERDGSVTVRTGDMSR